MSCPNHNNISLGYLEVEYARPILRCGYCDEKFKLNCDRFVFDTNILIHRLFSDLINTDFFDGKIILIPETVVDEINHWKNLEEKRDLYKIAIDEIKKIRSAHDKGRLKYKVTGKDASYFELLEKGRADKIIAKDAEKEGAIVITGDKDFYSINPDVPVLNYRYHPPNQNEIINVQIVGESNNDGVAHYKNYTIFIAGAGDRIGHDVSVEIENVFFSKKVATAILIE